MFVGDDGQVSEHWHQQALGRPSRDDFQPDASVVRARCLHLTSGARTVDGRSLGGVVGRMSLRPICSPPCCRGVGCPPSLALPSWPSCIAVPRLAGVASGSDCHVLANFVALLPSDRVPSLSPRPQVAASVPVQPQRHTPAGVLDEPDPADATRPVVKLSHRLHSRGSVTPAAAGQPQPRVQHAVKHDPVDARAAVWVIVRTVLQGRSFAPVPCPETCA